MISKKTILLSLLVIAGIQIGIILRSAVLPAIIARHPWIRYHEVLDIKKTMTFGELSKYFLRLSQKKGAVYAFDVLSYASLPPNIDIHLLGHVIGDELYKQKGIGGIVYCTQDFRNACSHAIVVGYFLRYGESGLPAIAETCRKAPGGKGAYTMCFHGLGHGVLTAVDYQLPEAIALCQKTGSPAYGFREASECTGGIIMEILSGGFHNKKLWEIQSPKYLKTTDPLYPCDSEVVPPASKEMCYEYMTPHLVAVAGGDLNHNPSDEVLTKAFSYCANLEQAQSKDACYRGFGKEFIVLAHNREIRNFDALTDSEIAKTYHLCSLTPDPAGQRDCETHAVDSVYWGGENDFHPAIRFCAMGPSDAAKRSCFGHLIDAMHFFVSNSGEKNTFCSAIPDGYGEKCRE